MRPTLHGFSVRFISDAYNVKLALGNLEEFYPL